MISLVFSELLKLRTTRALWVVLGLSAAFAAVIPILATAAPEQFGTAPLDARRTGRRCCARRPR